MIKGYKFILYLHNVLIPNQQLGKYSFIKWMPYGGLQFRINENQSKTIPAELIALAFQIKIRNLKIKNKVVLNQNWLRANGHTDLCFIEVITVLIGTYGKNI